MVIPTGAALTLVPLPPTFNRIRMLLSSHFVWLTGKRGVLMSQINESSNVVYIKRRQRGEPDISSDNGIYILKSKKNEDYEYRVAYAMNIDQIYGEFDDTTYHWKGNMQAIKAVFNNAPCFTSQELAIDYALKLSHDYKYLEDGICVIKDFSDTEFT